MLEADTTRVVAEVTSSYTCPNSWGEVSTYRSDETLVRADSTRDLIAKVVAAGASTVNVDEYTTYVLCKRPEERPDTGPIHTIVVRVEQVVAPDDEVWADDAIAPDGSRGMWMPRTPARYIACITL